MEPTATGNRWPLLLLLPLSVVGPPILALALILLLPFAPGDRGSGTGLMIFPVVVLILTIYATLRSEPGWSRVIFVLTTLAVTVVTFLFFAIGMMAP